MFLLLASPAAADKYDAARKQVEASMLLSGTIDVDSAGKVVAHAVDKAAQVEPAALEVLSRHVPHWRFEPVIVDGRAVHARARMRVRIVANQLENGDYAVTIKDTDFPALDGTQGSQPRPVSVTMRRPKYPETPLYRGASAIVYVVARVGATGAVEDAVAEQVNLGTIGEERDMALWRTQFAEAAVKAAKASRFEPYAAAAHSPRLASVRIPYMFELSGTKSVVERPYGQWSAYLPGARQPVPWLLGLETAAPDLLVSGESQSMDDSGGLKRVFPPAEG